MSIKVTLMLFSGRRDPMWTLTAGEIEELAPYIRGRASAQESSILGYRGFLIESDEPGLPPRFIVRDMREAEEFLLRSASPHVEAAVIAAVRAQLR